MPQWLQVPDWFSWHNQGSEAATVDLDGDGGTDLVVFMVDAPDGPNQGYYRIGRRLDNDGQPTGGWTPWQAVPDWFSWINAGAGVTAAAFAEPDHSLPADRHHLHDTGQVHIHDDGGDDDAQDGRRVMNLVVAQVDAPEDQNQGFYKIGRNLGADGLVHGGWSSWLGVPAWFSWLNEGAGVSARPPDEADGLIVLLNDSPVGRNSAYYRLVDVAADAQTEGQWHELPYLSEVLAVHGATLPTGKVLFFAGSGSSKVRFESPDFGDTDQGIWTSVVWDPDTPTADQEGDFFHPDTLFGDDGRPLDFFCCGHAFLRREDCSPLAAPAGTQGPGRASWGLPMPWCSTPGPSSGSASHPWATVAGIRPSPPWATDRS